MEKEELLICIMMKEILLLLLSPNKKNGMSLNEFMETIGLSYEECFIALDPLCEILDSLR